MRRFPLVLILLAAPAAAQETYSIAATAGQVADLASIVAGFNQGRCKALNLATNCTQAQACVAANAAGGASCTAAQARAAGARIYGNSQSEREDYVLRELVQPEFVARKSSLFAQGQTAYCLWWDAQNQTTKDAELTKIGFPTFPTGLTACPVR